MTMMVLQPNDLNDPTFSIELAKKVRLAPNFFRGAPLIIDLDSQSPGPLDFGSLKELIAACGLFPVGVQNATPDQAAQANAAGLAVFPSGRDSRYVVAGPAARPKTVIVGEPVRSGQQIYARDCDLIVTASVGAGAEIVADGHIHVYGALRGRAIAGAAGDGAARIFCQSLDAELVSIAGFYRVSEDLEQALVRKRMQIHLAGQALVFQALT